MRHHAEVAGELEMIVDLGGRFDAVIQVASELEPRCGPAAFDNVVDDRLGCACNLRFQVGVARAGHVVSGPPNIQCERVRAFPDEQLSKVLHATMSRRRLSTSASNECPARQITARVVLTGNWGSPD